MATTTTTMNPIHVDCDFRKTPKTATFCAVCQKDIKDPTRFVYWHSGCVFSHPDDLDGTELKVPVGSECANRFPLEYTDGE